jgi:hypothetical protein
MIQAMVIASAEEQLKSDDFYDQAPRSLICLPILHQGEKAGVSPKHLKSAFF